MIQQFKFAECRVDRFGEQQAQNGPRPSAPNSPSKSVALREVTHRCGRRSQSSDGPGV